MREFISLWFVVLIALGGFVAMSYDSEIRCSLGNIGACVKMYPAGLIRHGESAE